jgi:di/tricarboxylate transporter
MSEWIGESLKVLDSVPRALLIYCIALILTVATEFTSNVATANITLPVRSILYNLLYLYN